MKFLLQVRFNGAGDLISELPAGERQKVTAEFEAIRLSPGVLDGNQLQANDTAATVRSDGRQTRVTKSHQHGHPVTEPPPRVHASGVLHGFTH